MSSYLLTECIDDGKYNAMDCERGYVPLIHKFHDKRHGPAFVAKFPDMFQHWTRDIAYGQPPTSCCSLDFVYCMRILSWPPQAAVWPTRHRKYGWPDSETVVLVVSNGCDVVHVAHCRCRQDEWMSTYQRRLSFSRAKVVLLNSWIPVQQIVYHMLRVFVKTERLTDSANNSDAAKLSNYHSKTLMLYACELKPRSWWVDDLNVVTLSVELLHTHTLWAFG